MKETILKKLAWIEQTEHVRILLAVESGSRAWGFAFLDSDYDVRFVYVRPQNEYLRLEGCRDVIELPINKDLDINGWDLNKTLRLLYKSNPTLFEWFSSPIVYRESEFAYQFRSIMNNYFLSKQALYHYVSMASGNYREYLKTDIVKAKKYFYVLRPVLACRWIIDKGTPPPMLFSELMKHELPENMKATVNQLIDFKVNSPEIKKIPRIDSLNEFLDLSIDNVRQTLLRINDKPIKPWNKLNEMFLSQLII